MGNKFITSKFGTLNIASGAGEATSMGKQCFHLIQCGSRERVKLCS